MVSNGTKRPETARFGVVLGHRRPFAAGEKIYYFPSIAEPLNFFCAASNPKTADAYLGTGLGQHSRPPTLPFPQKKSA